MNTDRAAGGLPRLGELRRVDNANPDRKSHKPSRPNRRALVPVGLSWHSEISSHGYLRTAGVLRSIMVKLRSPAVFRVQFIVAAGLRLETFPAHHRSHRA